MNILAELRSHGIDAKFEGKGWFTVKFSKHYIVAQFVDNLVRVTNPSENFYTKPEDFVQTVLDMKNGRGIWIKTRPKRKRK